MNWLTRLALMCVFSGTAVAQTTEATTGTTTTTTGSESTTTGTTTGTQGGNSTPTAGFTPTEMEGAPSIQGGGASGSTLQGTNAFGQYYANPFYQGRPGSNGTEAPGGFGTPISGGSSGSGRTGSLAGRSNGTTGGSATRASSGNTGFNTGNTNAARTGTSSPSITGTQAGQGFGSGFGGGSTTSRSTTSSFGQQSTRSNAGGFGNTTGFGGANTRGGQTNSSIIATRARPVSSTLQLPIASFPTAAPRMIQNDVVSTLGRSSFLSNPGSINTRVEGNVVVLQGTVRNEEEARTAEGVARLTPGVRVVKSELKYPSP